MLFFRHKSYNRTKRGNRGPFTFPGSFRAIVLALALFPAAVQAVDYTLYLPLPENRALPVWMAEPIITGSETVSGVEIPITPPRGGGHLAATFFFMDTGSGFLRVLWKGIDSEATVAPNLLEGLGTLHQRTVLIDAALLASPGRLIVQSSHAETDVSAIRFEWVDEQVVRMTRASERPALLRDDQQLSETEVRGLPDPPASDRWEDWIVTAPLTEKVEAIEGGAVFLCELSAQPAQVRLAVKIAGLRPDTSLAVVINGGDPVPVSVQLPDLADLGHARDEDGRWFYAGWREATALLPTTRFPAGENFLRFVWAADAQGTEPVSVKDFRLQLRYIPPEEPAADPASAEDNGEATPQDAALPEPL